MWWRLVVAVAATAAAAAADTAAYFVATAAVVALNLLEIVRTAKRGTNNFFVALSCAICKLSYFVPVCSKVSDLCVLCLFSSLLPCAAVGCWSGMPLPR